MPARRAGRAGGAAGAADAGALVPAGAADAGARWGGRGGAAGGGGGAAGSGGAALPNLTIFVAGDSTVKTYTNSSLHQGGWGQFLASYFTPKSKVDNRAIGGRTSRRFIEEGRLTDILYDARAGDYLFVQFGTNDSNETATYDDGEPYYLAPDTDFKKYLQHVYRRGQERGVTPGAGDAAAAELLPSNGKTFNYSFGSYATAMYQLGQTNGVTVVDLGARRGRLPGRRRPTAGGPATNFFLIRADGTVDGTHFQEMGATILAGLVTQGVDPESTLPLAAYVK